ncbi:unnamed protein product [Coffea canephora]|uniref:Transmembrane protein 220 n=1 Tax=Coffea canephora TaxID=49390 RepID=A0A068U1K9_COFCA|nr:unnamed protein product [Coffea canephora]
MEAKISNKSLLFRLCSLLMASLFAVSASSQLNDPDWYFWFPLYACGCIVNLVNGLSKFPKMRLRIVAKFSLSLGIFLFIKPSIEDLGNGTGAGLWSLDMREKLGSGLVVASMFLNLQLPSSRHLPKGQETKVAKLTEHGMLILVGIGYGLSLLCHQKKMKF